jgi:hypothetical protein
MSAQKGSAANFRATNLFFQERSDGGDSLDVGVCESAGNVASFCLSGIGSLLQTPSSPKWACHGSETGTLESELKLDGEVQALVLEP